MAAPTITVRPTRRLIITAQAPTALPTGKPIASRAIAHSTPIAAPIWVTTACAAPAASANANANSKKPGAIAGLARFFKSEVAVSVVAIDALAPLVPLLCLDRQGGDRPRLETAQRDRFTGLLAITI